MSFICYFSRCGYVNWLLNAVKQLLSRWMDPLKNEPEMENQEVLVRSLMWPGYDEIPWH